MQQGDMPPEPRGLSAKDFSMLKIAIAATLNRHDDLLLSVEHGQRTGISDAEIRDILDEVVRRADPSVAESVRIVMQELDQTD